MWLRWFKVTDRIVACYDKSSKFLPYQLSMVVYWTTMAVTGNGELGFDSGEGAWETATTTTVWQQGRKLANPNSGSQWQEIANRETQFLRYWNENSVNLLARNNWRASLVPAAAVIPAPIAYIKVVAVKKLVVELLPRTISIRRVVLGIRLQAKIGLYWFDLVSRHFTVKKLECFRQVLARIH